MNCTSCNLQNEDNAFVCKNCGADLTKRGAKKSGAGSSSVLLFTFVAIQFVTTILNAIIMYGVEEWYMSNLWHFLQTTLWVVANLSFILPALAIRNKTMKIIGIIMVSIYSLYYAGSNVYYLIDRLEYLSYQ